MLISIFVGIIVLIYAGYLLFLKRKPHIDPQSKNYAIIRVLYLTKRASTLVGCVLLSGLSAWMMVHYSGNTLPTGSKIVILVDVSKSMLTQDMWVQWSFVSRLDAAKIRSVQLIEKLSGHPISIEAFAGESRIVTPFTLDSQKLQEALGTLSPDIVNTGGSDIAGAVNNAFARFEAREAGVIILMSDGDDRPADLTTLRSQVRTYPNIRIVSIGIGGSEPAPMIVGRDILGNIQYKTFEGKILQTKLEADNLKDISKLTRGEYMDFDEGINVSDTLWSGGEISKYSFLQIALKFAGILIIAGLILPYRKRWKN